MRFFKKIVYFLPLLLLLWFCRKPNVASWDVDVVLPVVTSQLNIKNFFGDSIFKADNTGLLNISVTRTLTAIKLDSLVRLPDTTIVTSFTLPVLGYTLNPGDALPSFATPSSALTFSIDNNVALETINVRSGFLNVTFSNTCREDLNLIYELAGAQKNGQSLLISEIIPATTGPTNSPITGTLSKSYDLAGYNFNMKYGSLYNTVAQTYTVKNSSANTMSLYFGEGVKVNVGYKNIVPYYIEGYFGKQTIDIPLDTTKLDILKTFEVSNFLLSEASLVFKILNEFGCEFNAALSNIKSINKNSVVALSTSQLNNININSSTKAGATIYPSVKTVSLTGNNSNILNFLSNLPDKLTFEGKVNVNPNGNISGYNDFAFYNTGIKVLADINIPLKFSANYFKLVSNTKIDFAKVKQLDNVNYGQFVISASNGYPFSAKIQAYLIDSTNNVIDSLFISGSNIIQKAELDILNNVKNPTSSKIYIPINQDKIANLKKSKTIKIESYFIMPPSPPDITIKEDYHFDINIVAELNYRAERK